MTKIKTLPLQENNLRMYFQPVSENNNSLLVTISAYLFPLFFCLSFIHEAQGFGSPSVENYLYTHTSPVTQAGFDQPKEKTALHDVFQNHVKSQSVKFIENKGHIVFRREGFDSKTLEKHSCHRIDNLPFQCLPGYQTRAYGWVVGPITRVGISFRYKFAATPEFEFNQNKNITFLRNPFHDSNYHDYKLQKFI